MSLLLPWTSCPSTVSCSSLGMHASMDVRLMYNFHTIPYHDDTVCKTTQCILSRSLQTCCLAGWAFTAAQLLHPDAYWLPVRACNPRLPCCILQATIIMCMSCSISSLPGACWLSGRGVLWCNSHRLRRLTPVPCRVQLLGGVAMLVH